MGLFDFMKRQDTDQGVKRYASTPNAVLLDVRTPQEYLEGHIPGSKNIPLQAIESIGAVVKAKDTALFVYCHSGARSSHAVNALQHMGYTNAVNIGGISGYTGKVER